MPKWELTNYILVKCVQLCFSFCASLESFMAVRILKVGSIRDGSSAFFVFYDIDSFGEYSPLILCPLIWVYLIFFQD